MNARPVLPRSHIGTTLVAVALSAVITLGLLNTVAGLFLRNGVPFEQLVIAERACASYSYVSERDICMRSYLAASLRQNLAAAVLRNHSPETSR